MKNLILINESKNAMPRKFLEQQLRKLSKELARESIPWGNRELTIVFLESAKARKLNRDYRGRDYATDVLSFQSPEGGDLALCPQVLKKQAKEQGHSFQQELLTMVVHGVLHLLGYDHEKSEKEAQVMFALQDKILRRIGP